MNFVTRFAPSPTGFLHIGNLRTAIFNYIISKRSNGRFILRLDDTDAERSTKEFSDQIKRDLEWLGFEWDECVKQSDRIALYKEAAKKLQESGDLYECFETPEELELKRKKQLNMGKPPVYDRSALRLSSEEKKKLREKKKSYWRLKLDRTRIQWTDGILGLISIDAGSISDPVLVRGDGQFLYTLASVVDDVDFKINCVIRGSDHVTNTATQIQLIKKLGSTVPSFAHHSLLVGPKGEPFSKRMNDLSLSKLKKMGLEPQAIFMFMATLGGVRSINYHASTEQIINDFTLASFGTAPTKYDQELLTSFSQKCLMRIPFPKIKQELDFLEIPHTLQPDFWEMAKENISKRLDLRDLWLLCSEGVEPVISPEDQDFISVCKSVMPEAPRDKDSWLTWITAIKSQTNRSGKHLFQPLRKALTGKAHGPDMKKLFPLLMKIRL